jgi:hypothetical protein
MVTAPSMLLLKTILGPWGALQSANMFPVKATIAAVLLGVGGLAGAPGAEFHEVELTDSASEPGIRLGPLALNQVGSGTFRRSGFGHQFAAADITVPAGDYEIRAWGETAQGGPLDTVLYVYRANAQIAINDDAPGSNESSALRLGLDGTYRIIVSTYRQSYWGTFHVLACPAGKCANAPIPGPAAPNAPRAP